MFLIYHVKTLIAAGQDVVHGQSICKVLQGPDS